MFCPACGMENRDIAKYCIHCGAALTAPPPPASGITSPSARVAPAPTQSAQTALLGNRSLLRGRYLIASLIAQGGMGAAYLAQDQQTFGRKIVIKEMLPYYTTPQEKAEAERNFRREGQVLAALNHPGIPQINDYFIEMDKYYLVMSWAEGDSLEHRIAGSPGGLPEKEVVDYGLQVAHILVYLAELKPPVMHRDIKPANIILNQQTRTVTLVDFGIAKAKARSAPGASAAGTGASTPMGTPGYSPPEQYQGATEPRSDVYALAATMHHLLTGVDPRHATTPFNFAPVQTMRPDISAGLDSLLCRALDMNIKNRPTAREMEKELQELATPSVVKHVSAVTEFHFRSGDTATTVTELAQKAELHWEDGAYHLMQGHMEPWLRAQNRHDLASIAEGIRQRGGDPSAGLEEFLRALNPQLPPPVLGVDVGLLDFGTVTKGESGTRELKLTNRGRGYLFGTLRSNVPWITLSASSIGCGTNQTQTVQVTLDSRSLKEGPHSRPLVEIETNGGRQSVAAQIQVAWAPVLVIKPAGRLNFGDVLANSKIAVERSVTIENSGGGVLAGQIISRGGWLALARQDFSVASGEKIEVQTFVQTAGLAIGIYEGQLSISSNAGTTVLPARLGIKKAMYDPPARTLRWGLFAGLILLALFSCSLSLSLGTRGVLGLSPLNPLGLLYFDLMRRFTVPNLDTVNILGIAGLVAFGVIGVAGYGLSRLFLGSLNEIEDYYHAGRLSQEIPENRFSGWRHAAVMGLFFVLGLIIGGRFDIQVTGDWFGWGLLTGPLAGAFIGGSLTVIGARVRGMVNAHSRLAAFERTVFLVGGMATWGAMLDATRGGQVGWVPPFVWALMGFVLASDSMKLPNRVQWLLAPVRPSLVIAFFGYILEAEANLFLNLLRYGQASFMPFAQTYAGFPSPTDPVTVIVDVILMAAILTGGAIGLFAINDESLERQRVVRTIAASLIPAFLLGLPGIVAGAIIILLLTFGRGWGLGVFLVTAATIAGGLSLIRFQAPQLEHRETMVKETLARLFKNRPLPGWLDRFSLVDNVRGMTPVAIGATALLAAMMLPLLLQVSLSLLFLLACLGILIVGLVVVFGLLYFVASQTKPKKVKTS